MFRAGRATAPYLVVTQFDPGHVVVPGHGEVTDATEIRGAHDHLQYVRADSHAAPRPSA